MNQHLSVTRHLALVGCTLVLIASVRAEAQLGIVQGGQLTIKSDTCRELNGAWAPHVSNLQGYWKLNEGSNTAIARDDGPRATYDTATAVGWGKTGIQNYGALFDGNTSGIVVNVGSSGLRSSMNSSYSMAAWIKLDQFQDRSCATTPNSSICTGFVIARRGNHGGIHVQATGATGRVLFGVWSGTPVTPVSVSSNTLSVGAWHHIVGVADDSAKTVKLYIDGALKASSSYSGSLYIYDSNPFGIGIADPTQSRSPGAYRNAFFGAIDEAAIWNTALAQSEVQTIYTNQSVGCHY